MSTDTLKNLIRQCLLLKPERREGLIARLDTLNENQIKEMEKAITESNEFLRNIIAKTSENEDPNTFNQKIDQIWKKYIQDTENISSGIENTAADNLLANL